MVLGNQTGFGAHYGLANQTGCGASPHFHPVSSLTTIISPVMGTPGTILSPVMGTPGQRPRNLEGGKTYAMSDIRLTVRLSDPMPQFHQKWQLYKLM